MRRLSALLLILAFASFSAWACDDDDEPSATPTTAAATATAPPAASPTLEAGILIEEPAEDTTVTAPVTMSGRANVFEAALTIDALGNAAGLVLCTRHLMATAGTGTEGTWEGVLAFAPPEGGVDVPITLRAYTFSPMDGSLQDLVERSVTLSSQRPNIVITSPSCAQDLSGTLTVTGMAQVFEAALSVEIRDASGTAVMTQNVMAASGTEFSPWTATFDLTALTPGFYDLVAYNFSAMDGSFQDEFPVQISVSP
jgi:hypothetical protein